MSRRYDFRVLHYYLSASIVVFIKVKCFIRSTRDHHFNIPNLMAKISVSPLKRHYVMECDIIIISSATKNLSPANVQLVCGFKTFYVRLP